MDPFKALSDNDKDFYRAAIGVVWFIFFKSWRKWNRRWLLLSFGLGLFGTILFVSDDDLLTWVGVIALSFWMTAALAWVSLYVLYDLHFSPRVWAAEKDLSSLSPKEQRVPLTSSLRVLATVLATMLLFGAFKHGEIHGTSREPEQTSAETPELKGSILDVFQEQTIAKWLYERRGQVVPVLGLALLAFVALMLFHPLFHAIEHLENRLSLKFGVSRGTVVFTMLLFMFLMSEHFLSHGFEEAIERRGWKFCLICLLSGAYGPTIGTYYWMKAMQLSPRASLVAPLKSAMFMTSYILSPIAVPVCVFLSGFFLSGMRHGSKVSLIFTICIGLYFYFFAFFFAVMGFTWGAPIHSPAI